jgi:hypothetical protein
MTERYQNVDTQEPEDDGGVAVLEREREGGEGTDWSPFFANTGEVYRDINESFVALRGAISEVEDGDVRSRLMTAAVEIEAKAVVSFDTTTSDVQTVSFEAINESLADSGLETPSNDDALEAGRKAANAMMQHWLPMEGDDAVPVESTDESVASGKLETQKEIIVRHFKERKSKEASSQESEERKPKKMSLKEFEKRAQANVTATIDSYRGKSKKEKEAVSYIESDPGVDWKSLVEQYKAEQGGDPAEEPVEAPKPPREKISLAEFERRAQESVTAIIKSYSGKSGKTKEEVADPEENVEDIEVIDDFNELLALDSELGNTNNEGTKLIIKAFEDADVSSSDRRKILLQLKDVASLVKRRAKKRRKLYEVQDKMQGEVDVLALGIAKRERELAKDTEFQTRRKAGKVTMKELRLIKEEFEEDDRELARKRKPILKAEEAVDREEAKLAELQISLYEMASTNGVDISVMKGGLREVRERGDEIIDIWREDRNLLYIDTMDHLDELSAEEIRERESQHKQVSGLMVKIDNSDVLAIARVMENLWEAPAA